MCEDDLDRGRGGAPADGGSSHDGHRRGRRQLSPEERRLRARVAAHAMHARNDGRRVTEHARRAFLDRLSVTSTQTGCCLRSAAGARIMPGGHTCCGWRCGRPKLGVRHTWRRAHVVDERLGLMMYQRRQ